MVNYSLGVLVLSFLGGQWNLADQNSSTIVDGSAVKADGDGSHGDGDAIETISDASATLAATVTLASAAVSEALETSPVTHASDAAQTSQASQVSQAVTQAVTQAVAGEPSACLTITVTQGAFAMPTAAANSTSSDELSFGGLGDSSNATQAYNVTESIVYTNVSNSLYVGPPPADSNLTVGGLIVPPSNVTYTNTTATNSTLLPNITNPTAQIIHGRAVVGSGSRPAVVDWRTRGGSSWLTTVQNQNPCGSCWSFAVTALVETMVRIEHGHWAKRSEADLRDSWGISCGTGSFTTDAGLWVYEGGQGLADRDCVPYVGRDNNYYPCADRLGRKTKLPKPSILAAGDVEAHKMWLWNYGPLAVEFKVYADFPAWTSKVSTVYKWDGKAAFVGWHAVLIVGYDDNKGAWIIRNSWGEKTSSGVPRGDKGYYLIGYGQVAINSRVKVGFRNTDPDPWGRRNLHNGVLLQSDGGETHHNFAMVRAANDGKGLRHLKRNGGGKGKNDFAWSELRRVFVAKDGSNPAVGNDVVGQPSILSSSFNRNFEMVYWEKGGFLRFWYFNKNNLEWYTTFRFPEHGTSGPVAGYPCIIQTRDSAFAISFRNKDSELKHYTRLPNNVDNLDEYSSKVIATGVLQSGPALVEATNNNLYTVAVMKTGRMQLFYQDRSNPSYVGAWKAGEVFGSNIGNTPPVMIQSSYHTTDETQDGAFQLVVAKNGQVQHWQRINKSLKSSPPTAGVTGQWQLLYTFGSNVKHVWSLVQGSFNRALEMVVELNNGYMVHYQYTNDGWKVMAVIPGKGD